MYMQCFLQKYGHGNPLTESESKLFSGTDSRGEGGDSKELISKRAGANAPPPPSRRYVLKKHVHSTLAKQENIKRNPPH